MKVRMLANKVAIEPISKVRKNQSGSLLTMPDTADCTGVVKYVAEDVKSVEKGQVVCYGTSRQRVKLGGEDLEIMEPDNIFAILDDEELSDVKTEEKA